MNTSTMIFSNSLLLGEKKPENTWINLKESGRYNASNSDIEYKLNKLCSLEPIEAVNFSIELLFDLDKAEVQDELNSLQVFYLKDQIRKIVELKRSYVAFPW